MKILFGRKKRPEEIPGRSEGPIAVSDYFPGVVVLPCGPAGFAGFIIPPFIL